MKTARDTGANLNEFGFLNNAKAGDCEILSNIYPSASECEAVEGRQEITANDFTGLSNVSSVIECSIVQHDGNDKFAVVNTAGTVKGFGYSEIVNIADNSVYENVPKYQWSRQSMAVIDECVYISGSASSNNVCRYYDTKELTAKARQTIRTTSRGKEIPLQPTVSVSTVVPKYKHAYLFCNGGSSFYFLNELIYTSSDSYTTIDNFTETPVSLADAAFSSYDRKLTDFSEESSGHSKRKPYKVNYIFVYVRHVEKNEDLFSAANAAPKVCHVFNVPESHGLIIDDIVTTHTIAAMLDNNNNIDKVTQVKTGITSCEMVFQARRTSFQNGGFPAFAFPKFTFSGVNTDNNLVTHIRVYRTAEVEGDGTFDDVGAQQGMAYRFLCDIEIKGRSNIVWQDGDSDLSLPKDERTFVCNDVHVASSHNLYTFFGCVNWRPSNYMAYCFDRLMCVDMTMNVLLMSMYVGQGGFQGGEQYPYMYRTLFAANNFIKVPEDITAVCEYQTRLIIFTRFKIYSVDNANRHKLNGEIESPTVEISNGTGTFFPNAIAKFDGKVFFVDSDGDISQIYGTEVKKTDIKIKAFREIAAANKNGTTTNNMVTAFAYKDMLIFNCNDGQDYFNFRLYCYIDRPSENKKGLFTYDRYEARMAGSKELKYGELDYGAGDYGYGEDVIEGQQVTFAAGNYMYAFGNHAKYRPAKHRRISKLFVDGLYEDEFMGEQ